MLEHIEGLTADADMHDEVRAKLHKAIGTELARTADAIDATKPEFVIAAVRALAPLREAVRLHDRVGIAAQIKRLEKAITKPAEPKKPLYPAMQAKVDKIASDVSGNAVALHAALSGVQNTESPPK